MNAEPALNADAEDDAEAADDMARYEAATRGERVSHKAVRVWILSKNTDSPLPRPKAGD